MKVVRFPDAVAFLARVRPWLMQAEVENNVIDTLASHVAEGSLASKEPAYFAAVIEAGAVVACAMRTPPHKLLIRGSAAAMQSLARDVRAFAPDLPAVNGPEPAAGQFVDAWVELARCTARFGTRQRLYKTSAVADDLPRTSGVLRRAEPRERSLAIEWANAFAAEAVADQQFDQTEAIDRSYRHDALFFWDDAGPVSMVAARGKTANSVRVGYVFTPRGFRRRGYATAAVAALTGRLLAEGVRYCCLYTDLANPTSNSIYQQIGYRPVLDFNDYWFAP